MKRKLISCGILIPEHVKEEYLDKSKVKKVLSESLKENRKHERADRKKRTPEEDKKFKKKIEKLLGNKISDEKWKAPTDMAFCFIIYYIYEDKKYGAVCEIRVRKSLFDDMKFPKISKKDWDKPVDTSKWVKPEKKVKERK